jgi:hypothetical protein
MSLHTVEEAHFLVRVGQWSIERLQQWLQDHIDAEYEYDDQDREDFTEWDIESD